MKIMLLGRKIFTKKFIKTKISKAKAHDFKKSEYLTARPIIKKVEGLKLNTNVEKF